jgi:hypothetical protein
MELYMFADPLTAKANNTDVSFAKTSLGVGSSEFSYNDYKVIVKQNTTAARFRREIRFTQNKIAADPITAVNAQKGASAYIVVDEPRNGFTDAELIQLVKDLADFVTRSTAANSAKLMLGEY